MAPGQADGAARRAAPWAAVAMGCAGCAALWTTGPGLPDGPWAPAFVRGYCIAWACYVGAAAAVSLGRRPRWLVLAIVIGALAMRLVSLERTPPLSTDVWRYLWDGRVVNAGINPYRHAPDDPRVQHLRDGNWRHINFRHIPTIYPPAAQVFFAAGARVRGQDDRLFRWAFAALDMGSILVLIALLRRTGRAAERVVWYAWCPLPVTEVTAGAHVDALGLFLLLSALLLAARREGRPGVGSALALAGAVLAKGFAVFAVPFFVRRGGWRTLGLFSAACAVMLAPFVGAGGHLFGGLRAYLGYWVTNSSLYLLFDWMLGRFGAPTGFPITRVATMAAVLGIVAWLTWRQREGTEGLVTVTFGAVIACLLIGAPTLPWYVVWSIPVLCWRVVPGLVLFSLTVSVQYYLRWMYPGMDHALLWAGYVPVYALLIGQAAWSWVRRRRPALGAAR